MDVPLFFAPRDARQYAFGVPFLVNGSYTVKLLVVGEGCPARLELANLAQKHLTFGMVPEGQQVAKQVNELHEATRQEGWTRGCGSTRRTCQLMVERKARPSYTRRLITFFLTLWQGRASLTPNAISFAAFPPPMHQVKVVNRSKRAIDFELVDTQDLGVGRLEGKGVRFVPALPTTLGPRESTMVEVSEILSERALLAPTVSKHRDPSRAG